MGQSEGESLESARPDIAVQDSNSKVFETAHPNMFLVIMGLWPWRLVVPPERGTLLL